MKYRIFLIFLLFLPLMVLSAEGEPWAWDAERGDAHYAAGDYDAAWLFFERALSESADDGLVIYRAADSFRQQQMVENPDFGRALYAVAWHFLQEQYPENPALEEALTHFDSDTVVNRQYLRKTYALVDGKAPKTRHQMMAEGIGSASGFFSSVLGDLGGFLSVLRNEGPREALAWARFRIWRLALALLMVNALTGIILPVVMAVTVAREGRKSYVTAYLFLLHWGPLGIHRFYLGRHVSGIIWLCTGGLLGLGVFFDLFLTGAYIRFWNEDHRNLRPSSGLSPTANSKPRKQKAAKSPGKPRKTKGPKQSRASRKTGGVSTAAAGAGMAFSAAAVSSDDEFSFPDPSGAASSGDDGFGELPEMIFDSDTDSEDFSLPTGGEELVAEGIEELSDDDFDLESLD